MKPLLNPGAERSDEGSGPLLPPGYLNQLKQATKALEELKATTAANTAAIKALESSSPSPPRGRSLSPGLRTPSAAPAAASAASMAKAARAAALVSMAPAPAPARAGAAGPPSSSVAKAPFAPVPSRMAPDDDGSGGAKYDNVRVKVTNPVCVGMVLLVLMGGAFTAGYVVREHQTPEEQLKYSTIEDEFMHTDAVEGVVHAIEPVFDKLDDQTASSVCANGLLLAGPVPTVGNTLFYLAMLLWSFLGVAVFADLFMLAIERITSTEAIKKVTLPNGKVRTLHCLVWNATIANLTLMALGSSAPEILLSVIEIMTSGFFAGELGPSTIVGSAAFNMLVISAVCVVAIPDGEGRLIKELTVFGITAVFSVLAYMWLLVILVYVTPNVVDVWEGIVTFAFFPLLVLLAYMADQGVISCACKGSASAGSGGTRFVTVLDESTFDGSGAGARASTNSKAYYRVNAMRAVSGYKSTESTDENRRAQLHSSKYVSLEDGTMSCEFNFFASTAPIREHEKKVQVLVFRTGNSKGTASVHYTLSTAPDSLEEVEFAAGQTSATVVVELLPQDKIVHTDGKPAFTLTLCQPSGVARIGKIATCNVQAVSGESPGVFMLAEDEMEVVESQGLAMITIRRVGGAKGTVSVDVNTKDGSAVAPSDYLAIEDFTILFSGGETEKTVPVTIINDGTLEGYEDFMVVFSNATGGATFSADCDGGPERAVATITIKGDDRSQIACPPRSCAELAFCIGANSDEVTLTLFAWSQQFAEAVEFDSEADWSALVVFLLGLPWKLAVAFAPPPRLLGGWACFLVVLALIGVLTALIGDLAGHMGCCMGLQPAITAITFVALGTSLPDTFASMSAASNEPYADSSIGNITGSNSVNVFLGLGLPWMIAAFYWAAIAPDSATGLAWHARYGAEPWYTPGMPIGFAVPAGDLGYSVMVFCGCAITCLLTLVLRRIVLGFELGYALRMPTAIFFVGLWGLYIYLSVQNSTR